MKYCPLRSQDGYRKCLGEECALAASEEGCLIKRFLELQVSMISKERERELVEAYWALKKDGTRTPIQFASLPDDCPYPHGGVYEDLNGLRDRYHI